MLCEPDLRGYIHKSKLTSLFGSVVMNREPLWGLSSPYLWEVDLPTANYLSNKHGALWLMSAGDTLNGLRKE